MADDLHRCFHTCSSIHKTASTAKVFSHERNCSVPDSQISGCRLLQPFITCVSQTCSNSSSFRIESGGREDAVQILGSERHECGCCSCQDTALGSYEGSNTDVLRRHGRRRVSMKGKLQKKMLLQN